MTDDATAPDDPATKDFDDPDGYSQDDLTPHDLALELLLRFITGDDDDSDGTATITLILDGGVVSGSIISSKAYAELVRESMKSNTGQGDWAVLGDIFDMMRDARGDLVTRRKAADLLLPPRHFIHMKDATAFAGDRYVRLPMLRAQVKNVSGWSYGALVPD